jgi:hypothetical protein
VIRLDVRADIDRVKASLKATQVDIRDQVAVRALNRTIGSVRAEAARSMKQDYGTLPIKTLKGLMRFIKANRTTLTAQLIFSQKRIRLTEWNPRQTTKGVRVKGPKQLETFSGDHIDPARTAELLSHAFIQKTRKGGVENVWIRIGRERYPIDGLVAPSLARTFVEGAIRGALVRSAQEKFVINFQRELAYALSKSALSKR